MVYRWYSEKLKKKWFLAASILIVAIILGSLLVYLVRLVPESTHGVVDAIGPLLFVFFLSCPIALYLSAFLHLFLQREHDYSPLRVTIQTFLIGILLWTPYSLFVLRVKTGQTFLLVSMLLIGWFGLFVSLQKTSPALRLTPKRIAYGFGLVVLSLSALAFFLFPAPSFPSNSTLAERDQWARKNLGESYLVGVDAVRKSPTILSDSGPLLELGPSNKGPNRTVVGWLDSGITSLTLEIKGSKAEGIATLEFLPRKGKVVTWYRYDWLPSGEKWVKPLTAEGKIEKLVYSGRISTDSLELFKKAASEKDHKTVVAEYQRAHEYDYDFYLFGKQGSNPAIVEAFQALNKRNELFQYYLDTAKWYWRSQRDDRVTVTRKLTSLALEIQPNHPEATALQTQAAESN